MVACGDRVTRQSTGESYCRTTGSRVTGGKTLPAPGRQASGRMDLYGSKVGRSAMGRIPVVQLVSVFHAAYAAPGMMKMGLISGKSRIGGWCRVGGRLNNGASSPRVSLARMSLRTRYCCPRLSGSTRSRMSPQRHPPDLAPRSQMV